MFFDYDYKPQWTIRILVIDTSFVDVIFGSTCYSRRNIYTNRLKIIRVKNKRM